MDALIRYLTESQSSAYTFQKTKQRFSRSAGCETNQECARQFPHEKRFCEMNAFDPNQRVCTRCHNDCRQDLNCQELCLQNPVSTTTFVTQRIPSTPSFQSTIEREPVVSTPAFWIIVVSLILTLLLIVSCAILKKSKNKYIKKLRKNIIKVLFCRKSPHKKLPQTVSIQNTGEIDTLNQGDSSEMVLNDLSKLPQTNMRHDMSRDQNADKQLQENAPLCPLPNAESNANSSLQDLEFRHRQMQSEEDESSVRSEDEQVENPAEVNAIDMGPCSDSGMGSWLMGNGLRSVHWVREMR